MKDATIYTFTTIRVPAPQFTDRAPFVTAILEDVDGNAFNAFVEGDGAAVGKKVVFKEMDVNNKPVYKLA